MVTFLQAALKGATPRVLAFDPGETTGAANFLGPELKEALQIPTGLMPTAAVNVRTWINRYLDETGFKPDAIVIEDYRVYSWKAEDHSWQNMHTCRLIGAIELICHDMNVPLHKQSAQNAKGFCTDDKLKAWGFWQAGERHARDAIRHAIFHLLFTVAKVHVPNKDKGH
jgi:hypothetical protein